MEVPDGGRTAGSQRRRSGCGGERPMGENQRAAKARHDSVGHVALEDLVPRSFPGRGGFWRGRCVRRRARASDGCHHDRHVLAQGLLARLGLTWLHLARDLGPREGCRGDRGSRKARHDRRRSDQHRHGLGRGRAREDRHRRGGHERDPAWVTRPRRGNDIPIGEEHGAIARPHDELPAEPFPARSSLVGDATHLVLRVGRDVDHLALAEAALGGARAANEFVLPGVARRDDPQATKIDERHSSSVAGGGSGQIGPRR